MILPVAIGGGAAVAASSAARNTSLPCIRVYCQ